MSAIGITILRLVSFGSIALMFVNAVVMLVSPRRWFSMPEWLRIQGSFGKNKYSHGSGAVEVRILGAIFVALILWVAYDMLARH